MCGFFRAELSLFGLWMNIILTLKTLSKLWKESIHPVRNKNASYNFSCLPGYLSIYI